MVVELKGSSVKERHWKQLMKQLRVVWVLSDLTLRQVNFVNEEITCRDLECKQQVFFNVCSIFKKNLVQFRTN